MKLSVYLILTTFYITNAQINTVFNLPSLEILNNSIDSFYNKINNIQTAELLRTKKLRFLSYLPSVGYSPFLGGFNINFNLLQPLNEIRLKDEQKRKITAITANNIVQATAMKNQTTVEYYRIQSLINLYKQSSIIDSLTMANQTILDNRYKMNEILPSDYLATRKAYEMYFLTRNTEYINIHNLINLLILNAKMGTTTIAPISLSQP